MALEPSRNTPLSASPIIGLDGRRRTWRLPRWITRHPWPVWALAAAFACGWCIGLVALVTAALN